MPGTDNADAVRQANVALRPQAASSESKADVAARNLDANARANPRGLMRPNLDSAGYARAKTRARATKARVFREPRTIAFTTYP